MRVVSSIAVILALLFIAKFGFMAFTNRGEIYSRIEYGWETQVDSLKLGKIKLPFQLDKFTDKKSGHRATMTNTINVPQRCSQKPCYLFFGEVGDTAKIYLNDHLVQSRGFADHGLTLARHYPLWTEISPDVTSPMKVRLDVETIYGIGFGVLRGPLFVGDYMAVRAYERELFLQAVVLPLMQALLLGILGLLVLACCQMTKLPPEYERFGVFAIVASAFMVSFSYLPREYLSVPAASFLHFALRILADWSLFETINALLPIGQNIKRFVRTSLALGLVALTVLFMKSMEYHYFVVAVQVISIVIIAIPAIALIAAIRHYLNNKRSVAPRELDLTFLIPTYAILTVCQVWDTSNFWNIVSGTYAVKFYLAPLAFIFTIVLARRVVRTQAELARSKAESERDALVGQIAIEFSHDLKSPLNALKTCADIALDSGSPEFIKKVLGDVARRTTEVTDRLQELLTYARDEIQERKQTPLNALADEIIKDLSPRIQKKKLRVVTDGVDLDIRVDRTSFKRALVNVIDNAIDASSENSLIRVSGSLMGDRSLVSIHDQGHGISPEDLPRVFEPYFTKNKEKGTGLGLAIVDRIIRQHGGSVRVFSSVTEGTTFVMEVPK